MSFISDYFFGGRTKKPSPLLTQSGGRIRRTGVKVIDPSAQVCLKLFTSCLNTHTSGSLMEKANARGISEALIPEYILRVASYIFKNLYENPSSRSGDKLEHMATLAVHLCNTTTTGRFSLILNDYVNKLILS